VATRVRIPLEIRLLNSGVEYPPCKRVVVGSNPTGGSDIINARKVIMIIDSEFCSKKDQLDLMNMLVGKNSHGFWRYNPRITDSMFGFSVQQSMRKEDFRMVFMIPPSVPEYTLILKMFNSFIEKNKLKTKQILQVSAILLPKSNDIPHSASINTERKHDTFIYSVNDSDSELAVYDQVFGTNHSTEHLVITDKLKSKMGQAFCFNGLNYHSIGYPSKSNYSCFVIVDFVPELMESGGKGGLYRY
jgi:hypothetical protein